VELLYSYVLDRKRLSQADFTQRWRAPMLIYQPGKVEESGLRRTMTETQLRPMVEWSEIKDTMKADVNRYRILRLALDTGTKKRTFRIGRERGLEIVINGRSVSKHHAELDVDGSGKLSLRDSGSKNGTIVDGRRLEGAALTLKPPTVIRFGSAEARLLGSKEVWSFLGEFLIERA
jgi:hypothetical protein